MILKCVTIQLKYCIINAAINASLFYMPLTRMVNQLFPYFLRMCGEGKRRRGNWTSEKWWKQHSMENKTFKCIIFCFRQFYTQLLSAVLVWLRKHGGALCCVWLRVWLNKVISWPTNESTIKTSVRSPGYSVHCLKASWAGTVCESCEE